ncbi:hypothetical protein FJT64_009507 [Amphibalanus amphitrite]|uniref:Uncharacterized protein n=1 Tax=Amphibalanus amphitrite TaxID=1232801 RepID=A0A6A4VHB4_AMPAM|nr:hypothetical protein FJT64_009507 [Amphibalanus amphitrite]
MRAGLALLCALAVLTVASARPQFRPFRPGSGGFGAGSGSGFGSINSGPGGTALNLGANANTAIDSSNGFASSSSLGFANGLSLQSPFGSTSNLNTGGFNLSQG